MTKVLEGVDYLVFDNLAWAKTGDVGDNSCYWHPATVKRVYGYGRDEVADVVWRHSGVESRGHFTLGLRPIHHG